MIADSRPYHHGDLRRALIDAGLDVTRQGGPDALALREVTRRLGVSANAAYRHFADREALLDAVAAEIFERVADRMAASMPTHNLSRADAALQQLRAVGLGYIGFARREPGWFQVVFFGGRAGEALATPPPAPYRALTDALDALVVAGLLSVDRRGSAPWVCWSAVHGFAELVIHGPLRTVAHQEVDVLAERCVDAVIAGVLAPVASMRQSVPATLDVQRSARAPAMPPSEK
ncbi:TetR/AcrR family transcriptional regulator [Planctomonas sp. JC2975]|uniref:WHG domain-containing protein n=1 Tax=Planctomonas sp. JC2975 TaxID=2729626 RepID=UPI001472CD37|nr:TetR/AcrR family transcriptional regulator [Planctomonas sp. JC2975]